MLAALLAGFLIFSGGNGFAAKMFGKDTRALVRQVVSEPKRADAAVQELELGQQDLEDIGKQLQTLVKDFSTADAVPDQVLIACLRGVAARPLHRVAERLAELGAGGVEVVFEVDNEAVGPQRALQVVPRDDLAMVLDRLR